MKKLLIVFIVMITVLVLMVTVGFGDQTDKSMTLPAEGSVPLESIPAPAG